MKNRELTKEAFDRFLTWLHADREEAARQYAALHRRLIIFFDCRGCADSEDLADQTLNRAIQQADDLIDSFVGDRASWLYGIAHYIHKEYVRLRANKDGGELPTEIPDTRNPDRESDKELSSLCLDQCLSKLDSDDRDLIVEYYRENKQAKIDHRKQLAEQRGWSVGNLRVRLNRLRNSLQDCLTSCLERQRDVTF